MRPKLRPVRRGVNYKTITKTVGQLDDNRFRGFALKSPACDKNVGAFSRSLDVRFAEKIRSYKRVTVRVPTDTATRKVGLVYGTSNRRRTFSGRVSRSPIMFSAVRRKRRRRLFAYFVRAGRVLLRPRVVYPLRFSVYAAENRDESARNRNFCRRYVNEPRLRIR